MEGNGEKEIRLYIFANFFNMHKRNSGEGILANLGKEAIKVPNSIGLMLIRRSAGGNHKARERGTTPAAAPARLMAPERSIIFPTEVDVASLEKRPTSVVL